MLEEHICLHSSFINITKKSMELIQSPKKLVWRRKFFFGPLDKFHGSFSDIGAHQDLQMPDFDMPELLAELFEQFILCPPTLSEALQPKIIQ